MLPVLPTAPRASHPPAVSAPITSSELCPTFVPQVGTAAAIYSESKIDFTGTTASGAMRPLRYR